MINGMYANTCSDCNACEVHVPVCSECYLCANCGCTHGIDDSYGDDCICSACIRTDIMPGYMYCYGCDPNSGCQFCGNCGNHTTMSGKLNTCTNCK